ncbi:hypothetical protein L1049_014679 [Liquidambar formosana]|uniref:Uncharacterized protein n=1 Tax=Liquidambar formosana TaxID=63359 RepID=A0AAP0RXL2_LIQFO
MAVGDDDMIEASASSLSLNSLESNQSGDVLSPDDIAWVDSCLIKDSEIADSNWNSLKDALLDILSSQPDSLDSSAAQGDRFPKNDIEILLDSEETEIAQFPGGTDNDLVPLYGEAEKSDDDGDGDVQQNKKTDTLLSQTYFKNAFLPNYNEDLNISENIDLGLDLGLPFNEMDPSTEDIFRVWDLDISADEEDELVKQLNKALAGSHFQSKPSTFNDSMAWKDMKESSVDDLIAGFGDLSLNRNSG